MNLVDVALGKKWRHINKAASGLVASTGRPIALAKCIAAMAHGFRKHHCEARPQIISIR
jgi:hypothetical protein